MKYILRILMLPFAWVLWTVAYSIKWVKYGGNLGINDKSPIKPGEFYALLKEVNDKLDKLNDSK